MPAKLNKPTSSYVRGRDLVLNEYTPPGSIGEIPMFLHQTWKSDMLKEDYRNSFDNWSNLHPGFLHVLWTDEDNDLLVATCFPELLPAYSWLPLIIQKTDFVRLMYLYRYGGIYADMDYVAHQALPPCLPDLCGFMAVHSPFSLNETLQNSLMISSPEHPVVLEALNVINQSVTDLQKREKYKNINLKNKFIGPLLSTFLTLSLTGPQVLDKAVSRVATSRVTTSQAQSGAKLDAEKSHPAAQLGSRANTTIIKLNDQFFKGPVATHLQHTTWWASVPKKCMPLISLSAFCFLFLITLVVLITFFACKRK